VGIIVAYRNLVLGLFLAGVSCGGYAAISFDGAFDGVDGGASAYTVGFDVTYQASCKDMSVNDIGKGKAKPGCTYDIPPGSSGKDMVSGVGVFIHGGQIAFGEQMESGVLTQYVFYSHPKGFKDNSYGTGVASDGSVGWGNSKEGYHKQDQYAKSEHFVFGLEGCEAENCGGTGFNIFVEYNHPGFVTGTDAATDTAYRAATTDVNEVLDGGGKNGTENSAIQVISTAEWNAAQHRTDSFTKNSSTGLGAVSPTGTFQGAAGDGTNCSDGTSSADVCYKAADGTSDITDWIFDAGVELQFTSRLVEGVLTPWFDFSTLPGGSLSNMQAADVENYFSLITTHASPAKAGENDPDSQIPDDGGQVPEPESLALFGLGLLIMKRFTRRRRRN